MKERYLKYLIIILAYLVVLYPLSVGILNTEWTLNLKDFIRNLYPLLGLVAFSTLWLHAISGVFEEWLVKNFNLDRFINITVTLILVCFVLHPVLLLISVGFSFTTIFSFGDADDIWFGIVGFLLLITYDIGKALKKHNLFVRHWNKILIISTIGFLLIFPHSLALGGDLQTGLLRKVWIFYGVTAILATIYTYGIKRFFISL